MTATRRTLITATPPTANGDLHLGHLSGPYVAADVYRRFVRLQGGEPRYICGGDDNQSFVDVKARQTGTTPGELAGRFNGEIVETLRQADARLDHYVQPLESETHGAFVTRFFRDLYDAGQLLEKESDGLWCESCSLYLYEGHVGGTCAHCGAGCDGNICEACAIPNQTVDMVDPRCKHCGTPATVKTFRRLYMPLSRWESELAEYYERVTMGSHLAALCARLLEMGLPDIPITHPTPWGLPVPVEGYEDQKIYAWFEMAPGYLHATEEMLRRQGSDLTWEDYWTGDDARVVQFFGFDNGYFHAVLFPAAYLAWDRGIRLPDHFVINEFYRLEGSKFSTSRNHAVWGKEALAHLSADTVRYFLAYDRPETEQNNFRLPLLRETVERDLLGRWRTWLGDLGERAAAAGNQVPELGTPTPNQQAFVDQVRWLLGGLEEAYRPETFSLQRVAALLTELARTAHSFGHAESHWPASQAERGTTALALELAALKAFALAAYPVMPGFAAEVLGDLGFDPETIDRDRSGDEAPALAWPRDLEALPAGRSLGDLSRDRFPTVAAGLTSLEAGRSGAAAS